MTKTIKIFFAITVLVVLIVPNLAFAQTTKFQLIPDCALGTYNAQRNIYEQKTAPTLNCVEQMLVNIAQMILGISGAIALLMFIYGGFLWLTAGGNSSKVQQGVKVMVGTVIGLVIIFGANLAVTTIRNVLVGQGLGTSQSPAGETPAGDSGTAPTTGGCCGGWYDNGTKCADVADDAACKTVSGGQGSFTPGAKCVITDSGGMSYGACQ